MNTTTAFACPMPGCDTFPFDRIEDLGEHVLTHTPAPAAAAPTVAAAAPLPAIDTVRSFSPGGTRAPATKSAPATDKQLSYVRSLLRRHPAESVDVESLTKTSASALIDRLVNTTPAPVAAPAAPAAAPAATPDGLTLEHGRVYATADGTFIKVTESKAGHLYGKLQGEDNKFTDYQRGALNRIVRHLTADEAAAFGHEHHQCVFCSRNLKDEGENRSVEVGYGPICADRYALPWG